MSKKGQFSWYLPESQYDYGTISCPTRYGGCGQRHEFELWSDGEIKYWVDICDNFDLYFQEEAEQEWNELFKEQYLKELGEWKGQEEFEKQEIQWEAKIKAGISLDERQYEEELGAYRPAGYRKGKQELFRCGKCSQELSGAGHHGKAKNRNNPAFWGIQQEQYKVLCGNCLEDQVSWMSTKKKHTFHKYRRRKQL